MQHRLILTVLGWLVAASVLAACGAGSQPEESAVTLAPVSSLPAQMQQAPAAVRTAYQFAVAHPDALENVPCYCGCGAMGHTSNLACYVKEFDAEGKPVFDDHALGCSICVDIAQDVMKMSKAGTPPTAIREYIVDTYSKFGPGNQ